MAQYTRQRTLQYSTFIKRALVESLTNAFLGHPDKTVQGAKVAIDTTDDRFKLPAVIIKFYERELPNAGIGHVEYLVSPTDPDPINNPTEFIKHYHRMYKGDISFEVYGQSSVDRDIVRDALVEVLTMQELTPGGNNFLERFYFFLQQTPYGQWHYPVLNLDLITGYGEQQSIAPWMAEDVLVYQVSYRVPIFGEFYSITPEFPASEKLLQEVDLYVWQKDGLGNDLEPPVSQADPDDYYKFTGWPPGAKFI